MTDREWDEICVLIDDCWKGELDERKATSYRLFLDRHPQGLVFAALEVLVEGGVAFLPSVPEIVKSVRSLTEQPLPGWTEVYEHLSRATRRAGADYHAPEQAKTAVGAAWLDEYSHAVVARFFEGEGYGRMSKIGYDDPDYGLLRQKELRDRWDQFCKVAEQRLVQGRALEASGQRALGGPRSLSQAALLQVVKAPEQLGPGE